MGHLQVCLGVSFEPEQVSTRCTAELSQQRHGGLHDELRSKSAARLGTRTSYVCSGCVSIQLQAAFAFGKRYRFSARFALEAPDRRRSCSEWASSDIPVRCKLSCEVY